jgi:hypothetical protein
VDILHRRLGYGGVVSTAGGVAYLSFHWHEPESEMRACDRAVVTKPFTEGS